MVSNLHPVVSSFLPFILGAHSRKSICMRFSVQYIYMYQKSPSQIHTHTHFTQYHTHLPPPPPCLFILLPLKGSIKPPHIAGIHIQHPYPVCDFSFQCFFCCLLIGQWVGTSTKYLPQCSISYIYPYPQTPYPHYQSIK